jgi:hypothetical protein
MSNDLISFLSNVEILLSEEEYSYVYFDSITGKIEKISSKKENDKKFKVLKVKFSLVKDLVDGKKRLEDYCVIYNSKIKDFEILELEKNLYVKNINNSLFKVDKNLVAKKDKIDVLIQQDNKNKNWIFIFNKKINFLKNVNDYMFFSITEKNDPNILYRTISFSITDLKNNIINIPYKYEVESDIESTSIFVHKVLDSYVHEVLND